MVTSTTVQAARLSVNLSFRLRRQVHSEAWHLPKAHRPPGRVTSGSSRSPPSASPDLIAERLTRAIREGALQPGDRLPTELELARDFGVGRTSVREGLQKLRAHGLIESRKGLGAFVAATLPPDPLADFERWTQSDPRAIEHLVEGRFALEALAAALAALRATDEELAEIEHHHLEHAGPVSATTATP